MKKILFTVLATFTLLSTNAQKKRDVKDINYRRSSLHTMLIESEDFPRKDVVLKSYNEAPFPEKYNNHTIETKSFKVDLSKNDDETAVLVTKHLNDNKIANQLVAKWFNRQPNGAFNMELIGKRGSYNASEMQANIAKGSVRGVASLADAGEELINNTFIIVNKLNFVSNEIAAAILRKQGIKKANKIKMSFARKAALKGVEKAYNKAKEGYSVWTTAYLYKLVWNEEIAATFYNNLWVDNSGIDKAKVDAFKNSDLFKMEFVGKQKTTSLVLFSLKEERTEEQIIKLATVRNLDAVYAKLQREYDVFKTKTPLYSGEPITAKIGMKEGLVGGESFEVLEQVLDEKTGLTKYVRKGKIKVIKDKVWDNRFNAGEDANDKKSNLTSTTFKGGKDYYSGMLIRQLK
ncbi:hypothetical protein [Tenacibaculum soleae]|uniref:hypothetical protein n=1 Tax=Tenacibaculum soleae TaxID=447689 RepID=UPI002300B177|nr:hypothetical protein [Tenacibaculum soleae]